MTNLLVRLFGIRGALLHGDCMVIDRWRWLRRQLPEIPLGSKRLLDVGCGSGAFTIGFAEKGYKALGISWDERNHRVAEERASICKAGLASFEIHDVRNLSDRSDWEKQFDTIICCENLEHIVDDRKLMREMNRCLKPAGRLLLTTPNVNYVPLNKDDDGPFLPIEDGRHVRKGYDAEMLRELCSVSNFIIDRIEFCSGYFSQKVTALQRLLSGIDPRLAWLVVLPFRWAVLMDSVLMKSWPFYSICLVATKRRD